MTQILSPEIPVLMVDDEIPVVQGVSNVLIAAGINNLIPCYDASEVIGILASREIAAIMLDLSMPRLSGEELLPDLVASHPEVPVIVVTGLNEVDIAVRCIRMGAFDYMVKPVEKIRLVTGVRRAIELRQLRRENERICTHIVSGVVNHPEAFSDIVTNNASMHALFRYCESIAHSQWPVLIAGETGVGKELFARAIHTLSGRKGAFVAVNAAGLDDAVFSDTLFGHLRGAYTGAAESRKGLIEQAAGGTLFLDEIGDLTPMSQVKLLRVVQEREYYPIGSDVPKKTDARLICASNQNLDCVRDAEPFRKDLYHRLRTHYLHVPPLRKRLDDIPLLVNHFIEMAAAVLGKKPPATPKELYTLLATYSFPGNVRELESMISDAVTNHHSHILSMAVFENRIAEQNKVQALHESGGKTMTPYALFDRLPTLEESAWLLIEEALRRAEGNQTIAARLLGISRTALNKRLHHDRDL